MPRAPATQVAVHLPKTAGTSLRVALEATFADGLQLDYDDRPLQHGVAARRFSAATASLRNAGRELHASCIYGHFLPLKYSLARNLRFSIWLRDPVQRVISRYHHYRRACAAGDDSHARWGLQPGLDLVQFARLPHYQNTLAHYLWAFPLRRFGFIGSVEAWDEDFPRFFASLGREAPQAPGENRNPERHAGGYAPEPGIRRLIESLNRQDLKLHAAAMALRDRQCRGDNPARRW